MSRYVLPVIQSFGNFLISPQYGSRIVCKETSAVFSLHRKNYCEATSENNDNDARDPTKDRTKVIPVETSIKYMNSAAYKETYGDLPVWVKYRRNHKGRYPPKLTRKTCVRQGVISTGNPCPICRDEYLVLHHSNTELLKQFISPYNGEILSYSKTGVCQKKHRELLLAIEKAKDYGFIPFDVPIRMYDYDIYKN